MRFLSTCARTLAVALHVLTSLPGPSLHFTGGSAVGAGADIQRCGALRMALSDHLRGERPMIDQAKRSMPSAGSTCWTLASEPEAGYIACHVHAPSPANGKGAQVMGQGMRRLTGMLCTALLGFAHPALADAIDGDWCRADGKRMMIQGPAIVTPGGQHANGSYTRHAFSYVIPAGEAGAGATVSIQLLSEYLAHARQGVDAPVQEWRRCQPGVS
jgi:hypothetical protein